MTLFRVAVSARAASFEALVDSKSEAERVRDAVIDLFRSLRAFDVSSSLCEEVIA